MSHEGNGEEKKPGLNFTIKPMSQSQSEEADRLISAYWKVLKRLSIIFVICFLFYLLKGWIQFGPWGDASGEFRRGITSVVLVSIIPSIICTGIFHSAFNKEKPFHRFFKYSWTWVFILFVYMLLPKSGNHTVYPHPEKYLWAYENGFITWYGAADELSNPFTLMALISSVMLFLHRLGKLGTSDKD
jgi:hypothetical protein